MLEAVAAMSSGELSVEWFNAVAENAEEGAARHSIYETHRAFNREHRRQQQDY